MKMARYIYLVLVGCVLSTCCITSVRADEDGYVEAEADAKENKNNLKIFMPTHEWKQIQPDETIFTGLHYRMNMETGFKEAKLMEGSDGKEYYQLVQKYLNKKLIESLKETKSPSSESKPVSSENKNHQVTVLSTNDEDISSKLDNSESSPILDGEAISEIKKKIKDFKMNKKNSDDSFLDDVKQLDDTHFKDPRVQAYEEAMQELKDQHKNDENKASIKNKFRSYEQLKEELKDLNLEVENEQSQLTSMINKYIEGQDNVESAKLMEDMEFLLHAVDNAKVFIDRNGLSLVISKSLNSTNSTVRLLGCRMVTACVQNFRYGQVAAFEAKLLPKLVKALDDENMAVSLSAVTALSSLVRHFREAQNNLFLNSDEELNKVFRSTSLTRLPLRIKLMTMLSDVIIENKLDSDSSQIKNYDLILGALNKIEWCDQLVDLLNFVHRTHFSLSSPLSNSPTYQAFDSLQRVMSAVSNSRELCPLKLSESKPILSQLNNILTQLAEGEEDLDLKQYYGELRQSVVSNLLDMEHIVT